MILIQISPGHALVAVTLGPGHVLDPGLVDAVIGDRIVHTGLVVGPTEAPVVRMMRPVGLSILQLVLKGSCHRLLQEMQ